MNSPTATKPWDARLAAALVTPFVRSSLHPNHFTLLRLGVGLAGAACFMTGRMPNVAAGLIVVSNFLDHTDGEFARMSGKTSRFGHYFDLVSDAVVTVGMFIGIGIGLTRSGGGMSNALLGAVAGIAVAVIFQLRNIIETHRGKSAIRQPQWAGFEAEDVLYLIPLVTLFGVLEGFLYAAAIGAPIACLMVVLQYVKVMGTTPRKTE